MATLVFSAIGTLIGGPLGGAIGALVGQQVDRAIIGSPTREGARLKELAVTTSSYGSAIPRVFGTMRVPGTIIWSTDLVEHKEKVGGGKGRPSTNTYTYSASFAVALSSREIASIGRIWADGNLLRGEAGDLKVGGNMRVYRGTMDQQPDTLVASAEGIDHCPAYRGLAYVVFEDLQLADFGNRIPALTFEVIADRDPITIDMLAKGLLENVSAPTVLTGIDGLTCDGPLADLLGQFDPFFPMGCDVSGDTLVLGPVGPSAPKPLGEPTTSTADDAFGARQGFVRRRTPRLADTGQQVRFYDVGRDFQIGLQRSPGRSEAGQLPSIDLPAAMTAQRARALAAEVARRARWSRDTISWRTAELDPDVAPGSIITLPQQPGVWRIVDWEWRNDGIELSLVRHIAGHISPAPTDGGRSNSPIDGAIGMTDLVAFELPWDGRSAEQSPTVFVAVSSAEPGWRGAALFADDGAGQLRELGPAKRTRATIGTVQAALAPAAANLFDRANALIVSLVGPDLMLESASTATVLAGANKALVGGEIIQFANAERVGATEWKVSGLLRGRGGTEPHIGTHQAGERFVLLDDAITPLPAEMGPITGNLQIAAVGLGDTTPAFAPIIGAGIYQRPLSPVHAHIDRGTDGSATLTWTRRARGAWTWADGIDIPINEQHEAYLVSIGDPQRQIATWEVAEPALTIDSATLNHLRDQYPEATWSVRQRGNYALSLPLQFSYI